jgi:hypothetical protein
MFRLLNISNIFKSILFFIRIAFQKKKIDVLLFSPNHFNRIHGQNIYFKPLIEIFDEKKISYLFFEEPSKYNYQSDKNSVPFDIVFIFNQLARKLRIDVAIVNNFFFKNIYPNKIITISNTFLEECFQLFPSSIVYDTQHGIIYKDHAGYALFRKHDNKNYRLLLQGNLYKDMYTSAGIDTNRLIVLGHPFLVKKKSVNYNSSVILITSLLVNEGSKEILDRQFKIENKLLKDCIESIADTKYEIYFKPHPRFDKKSIDNLIKNPRITFVYEPLNTIQEKVFLHITLASSSIFEFSSMGVPSYLYFFNEKIDDIYFNEFKYPLKRKLNLKSKLDSYMNSEEKYIKDSNEVFNWYWMHHDQLLKEDVYRIFKH